MVKSTKILIVEDDKNIRELFIKKLSEEGFTPYSAKNGEEGLQIAKKELPALILMDLEMPVLDGLSMLKTIRVTEKLKDIPVIVLTNFSDSEKQIAVLEHGVFDYLLKADWSFDQILIKIKERLA